jgi:hypothetical protein
MDPLKSHGSALKERGPCVIDVPIHYVRRECLSHGPSGRGEQGV